MLFTWLTNLGMRKVPGYRGQVQRVDFHFANPSLSIQGLSLAKSTKGRIEQLLDINSVIVGIRWKNILTGALVGHVQLDAPRLQLNLESSKRDVVPKANAESNSKANPDQRPWQEKVKRLRAFRVTSTVVTDGEVHVRGVEGQNQADIRIDRLNLSLDNVTNSARTRIDIDGDCHLHARVMATGSLELRVQGYPLAQPPTFNLDFQTTGIDQRNFVQ